MFSLLAWCVVGLIAGAIAKYLFKDTKGTWLSTLILGLFGSLVGGVLASFLGLGTVQAFSFLGLIFAVLGAIVVLFLYHRFCK